MKTRSCSKCGCVKRMEMFYRHPQGPYGRMSQCKECIKAAAIKNRKKNREYYLIYDRKRARLPHRIALRNRLAIIYKNDPVMKKKIKKAKKLWQDNNIVKRAAHVIAGNAIRDGILIKGRCEVCGKKKVDAHHDDYKKPLSVRWLCRKHHMEHHRKERGLIGSV